MRRSLVATLLSGSFVLQLLLAGGGATCVMPGTGAAGAGDMAGMDMPMPAGGSAPASSDDPAPSRAPDQAPCDQPATPASCHVMAPCAASFVAMPPAVTEAEFQIPPRVVAARALKPASLTYPPELPPPRA